MCVAEIDIYGGGGHFTKTSHSGEITIKLYNLT